MKTLTFAQYEAILHIQRELKRHTYAKTSHLDVCITFMEELLKEYEDSLNRAQPMIDPNNEELKKERN